MKKSLLAVAVAAALPTFAQAQSSVTLFGILDASVEYSNDQANATLGGAGQTFQNGESGMRVNSGTQSGSRFGVRGSEDLGGGLKAIFTIEHRLDISTGDTQGGNPFVSAAAGNNKFWNGQAWVGLEGRWGALTMGRQYSPIFWALIPADFTAYTFYNNWAAFSGTNLNGGQIQGPFRLDNSVSYKSPTFGGLTVYAVYAFGENLTNNPATATAPGSATAGSGDVFGLAAGWQLGGLYLSAGYHSIDSKAYGTGGTATALTDVAAAAASYKWTNFGLSLGYTQLTFAQVGASDAKMSNVLLSAFANFGPGTLYVSGSMLDASDFIGRRNDSALQYGVAYSVPLSKRTNWYVALGGNDVSGLQLRTATTLIDSQQRVSVGVRHLF